MVDDFAIDWSTETTYVAMVQNGYEVTYGNYFGASDKASVSAAIVDLAEDYDDDYTTSDYMEDMVDPINDYIEQNDRGDVDVSAIFAIQDIGQWSYPFVAAVDYPYDGATWSYIEIDKLCYISVDIHPPDADGDGYVQIKMWKVTATETDVAE